MFFLVGVKNEIHKMPFVFLLCYVFFFVFHISSVSGGSTVFDYTTCCRILSILSPLELIGTFARRAFSHLSLHFIGDLGSDSVLFFEFFLWENFACPYIIKWTVLCRFLPRAKK